MKFFSQLDRNPGANPSARSLRRADQRWWITVAAFCAAGNGLPAAAQNVIGPASDLLTTPAGGTTMEDFSGVPIPANFFGPGSDPDRKSVV